MDNNDNKNSTGKKNQLRVDILADRLEIYRIMAMIFYRRLDDKEKIDALIEVAETMKEEGLDGNGNR